MGELTVADVQASYSHRMGELRGKVSGRDKKLARWAETALDAVREGRIEVAEERLEELIREIAAGLR